MYLNICLLTFFREFVRAYVWRSCDFCIFTLLWCIHCFTWK